MSTLLGEIDMQAILADLPTDQRDGGSLIGHGAEGIVEGPKDYLLRYFRALQEFYEKASRQGLLVVLWWD